MNETKELSAPAAAVQRTTEAGHGCLSVGRPWVQFEGWMLKESGALTGGWHLRYFVVSGDRLEYFKEEKLKIDVKPGDRGALASLGFELDQTNVVCVAGAASVANPKGSTLHEGDVIIGVNGEPCVGTPARGAVEAAAANSPITLTVLRPKGQIALHGAAVVPAGPRKGGGHILTVSVPKSKSNLVCADERLCAGWIASIKEAIAASAMEEIKAALSQALSLRALQEAPAVAEAPSAQPRHRPSSPDVPPRPSSAPPPQNGMPQRRAVSYNNLSQSSIDEHARFYGKMEEAAPVSARRGSGSSVASERHFNA